MTKKEFDAEVIMAVEIEYEDGGRNWYTMHSAEVKPFIDARVATGDYLSDIDYSSQQEPEVREILDKAWEIFMQDSKKFGSFDKAIDSLLEDDEPATPAKKMWTEEQIANLIQSDDRVLYRALKKLYAEQTADEQNFAQTTYRNGAGFNSVDAKFLTSASEFLLKTGFLTSKQKAVVRRKLVKYNKQLTRLANA